MEDTIPLFAEHCGHQSWPGDTLLMSEVSF